MRPSVAPVTMIGTTGTPGHIVRVVRGFTALITSGRKRRGRRARGSSLDRLDLHLRSSATTFFNVLAHVVERVLRQHAAVHRRGGELRQGIEGMTALEHVATQVVRSVEFHAGDAAATRCIAACEPSATCARSAFDRPRLDLRHLREVRRRHFVRLERKAEAARAARARRPDGRWRCPAQASSCGRPCCVTSKRKLTTYFSLTCRSLEIRLPFSVSPQPPSLSAKSASIRSRWFLISQSTPLYGPPPSSSAVSATMMSRSGLNPSRFVPDQVGDPDRGLRLVVAGSAAVEVAVLLDEQERVHAPVLALGLDDVRVGEQQDRLARAGAVIAHDEIELLRRRRRRRRCPRPGSPASFRRAAAASATGVVAPV